MARFWRPQQQQQLLLILTFDGFMVSYSYDTYLVHCETIRQSESDHYNSSSAVRTRSEQQARQSESDHCNTLLLYSFRARSTTRRICWTPIQLISYTGTRHIRTVKRFGFVLWGDRFSALVLSIMERVPKLNNIFSESSRPDISKNRFSIANLPIVEILSAGKRSHSRAQPKQLLRKK